MSPSDKLITDGDKASRPTSLRNYASSEVAQGFCHDQHDLTTFFKDSGWWSCGFLNL